MTLDGKLLGVLGESGKQPKQFGWVHEIACPSENVQYVAEILNWRVQKLLLNPDRRHDADGSPRLSSSSTSQIGDDCRPAATVPLSMVSSISLPPLWIGYTLRRTSAWASADDDDDEEYRPPSLVPGKERLFDAILLTVKT
jgi:hypothetical protein